MSHKIFIFLLYVVLLENYFGCASPANFYAVTKENKKNENSIQNKDIKSIQQYDYFDSDEEQEEEDNDDYECVPESNKCTCKCTKDKMYDCDACVVLKESSTATCTPGEVTLFYCPVCPCDEEGRHVCEKCYQKRINPNEKVKQNLGYNDIYRKKREADYDDLYNDRLPLSTEQIRELHRQAYFQRRQEAIDKRREKQELAEQQAELARQNAEMRKELEYQRRLDEEQRALDAQQEYVDLEEYVDEDDNQQEQEDYYTKKISGKKLRF